MRPIFLRLILGLCGCAAVFPAMAQDDAERLRIHGSNALGARLIPSLIEAWLRSIEYHDVRQVTKNATRLEIHAERDGMPLIVEIDKRGSGPGLNALVDRRAELAMVTRAPNASEMDAAWQLGDLRSPDQEFVIALDGIAVIVNNANPVKQLSVTQLRDIYSGKINNWRELGGPSMPIRLHIGHAQSGTHEFMRERVMGTTSLTTVLKTYSQQSTLAAAVAVDRAAIGIVDLRMRLPIGTNSLAISDGGLAVTPSRLDVLSEDYPLVRRFMLYGGGMMSAFGRGFALFTMTRAGQEAVERAGYMAVTLRPVVQPPVATAPTEYVQAIESAERLPLSLRFNFTGSLTIFDSRTAQDLDRLVAFMHLPENRSRSVVVVAFADRDPKFPAMSALISNDRADIIAEYLSQSRVRVRRVRGMGALRPLTGTTRPDARYRNERVEVWML